MVFYSCRACSGFQFSRYPAEHLKFYVEEKNYKTILEYFRSPK